MSNNATRIIKIELAEESTFSLSGDEWLRNHLDTSGLTDEGTGILSITDTDLAYLSNCLDHEDGLNAEEKGYYRDILDHVKRDIADNRGEYAEYMCG